MLSTAIQPRAALGWCQLLLVAAIAWTAHELGVSLPYWPINPAISTDIRFNFKLDFVRALWAVLPPAILWGASFPLALAAVSRDGHAMPAALVGGIYAANTIGAVAGALDGEPAAGRVDRIAAHAAGHDGRLGAGRLLVLVPVRLERRPTTARHAAASRIATYVSLGAALAVAALLTVFSSGACRRSRRMLVAHGRFAAALLGQAGDIIYVGEGLQSSVAVSRLPTGKLGYHNAGKIQASSAPEDMRLQRMLGHLTTLVPDHPRSVLVIGCGAGVTAGAVSIDPLVERVTIAEIEPLVPRVVSTYFSAQNYDVVRNPKVHIHIDDARHYLLTSRGKVRRHHLRSAGSVGERGGDAVHERILRSRARPS